MDLAKRYKDSDGEDRNILQMVTLEKEWAANRIQEGEKAIARVEELEDLLRSARNIADREGALTAWVRFSERIGAFGIGSVTAKTFKILPSDGAF